MSLSVQADQSLLALNTFGLPASARLYVSTGNDGEVAEALALARAQGLMPLPLGGGSNLLLRGDIDALVLRMASRGIRLLRDDGDSLLVEAEAGEPWQSLVDWALQRALSGLENLTLIPGTVGAAPVQNIGAYGVELADVFAGLQAMHAGSGELREFSVAECRFGYRDSRFKEPGQPWIILRLRVRLLRSSRINVSYAPLRQRLRDQGIESPSPHEVARAVAGLRREKLPDPALLGNAGSFFANPLVSAEQAARLEAEYPELVAYVQPDGRVKLAAAWLIERAGWKGYRDGPVGVHQDQALVLVNHGGATGEQVLALAGRIQASIRARFGVDLQIEPRVI